MKVKHSKECPICFKALVTSTTNTINKLTRAMQLSGQSFICSSPLADKPLHYYTHTVHNSDPNAISLQEFSVDLGQRYVLFNNNYTAGTSIIKLSKHGPPPLEVPSLLIPDFPDLENLKRKISLMITFS